MVACIKFSATDLSYFIGGNQIIPLETRLQPKVKDFVVPSNDGSGLGLIEAELAKKIPEIIWKKTWSTFKQS